MEPLQTDHDISLIHCDWELPDDEPYPIHHDRDEPAFLPIDCDCWTDPELSTRGLYCPACDAEARDAF